LNYSKTFNERCSKKVINRKLNKHLENIAKEKRKQRNYKSNSNSIMIRVRETRFPPGLKEYVVSVV